MWQATSWDRTCCWAWSSSRRCGCCHCRLSSRYSRSPTTSPARCCWWGCADRSSHCGGSDLCVILCPRPQHEVHVLQTASVPAELLKNLVEITTNHKKAASGNDNTTTSTTAKWILPGGWLILWNFFVAQSGVSRLRPTWNVLSSCRLCSTTCSN